MSFLDELNELGEMHGRGVPIPGSMAPQAAEPRSESREALVLAMGLASFWQLWETATTLDELGRALDDAGFSELAGAWHDTAVSARQTTSRLNRELGIAAEPPRLPSPITEYQTKFGPDQLAEMRMGSCYQTDAAHLIVLSRYATRLLEQQQRHAQVFLESLARIARAKDSPIPTQWLFLGDRIQQLTQSPAIGAAIATLQGQLQQLGSAGTTLADMCRTTEAAIDDKVTALEWQLSDDISLLKDELGGFAETAQQPRVTELALVDIPCPELDKHNAAGRELANALRQVDPPALILTVAYDVLVEQLARHMPHDALRAVDKFFRAARREDDDFDRQAYAAHTAAMKKLGSLLPDTAWDKPVVTEKHALVFEVCRAFVAQDPARYPAELLNLADQAAFDLWTAGQQPLIVAAAAADQEQATSRAQALDMWSSPGTPRSPENQYRK